MYYDEHNPPHFHANYNEFSAMISIKDFTIIYGYLPPRVLGLVVEWASLHKTELSENWMLAKKNKPLNKIKPLQ